MTQIVTLCGSVERCVVERSDVCWSQDCRGTCDGHSLCLARRIAYVAFLLIYAELVAVGYIFHRALHVACFSLHLLLRTP